MRLDLNRAYRFDSTSFAGVGRVVGYRNNGHIAKVKSTDGEAFLCAAGDATEALVIADVIEQLDASAKYVAVPLWAYRELKEVLVALVNERAPTFISVEIPRKRLEQYLRDYVVIALKDERFSESPKKRKTDGYAKYHLGKNPDLRCCFCQGQLTMENVTAEHIVPYSMCHNNSTANLCLSDTKCNEERGVTDFYTFLAYKQRKRLKKMFPGLNIKRYVEVI